MAGNDAAQALRDRIASQAKEAQQAAGGATRSEAGEAGALSTPRSALELSAAIQKVFDRWDVDRSGQLSLAEFAEGISNEVSSPDFRDDPAVRVVYHAAVKAGAAKLFDSPSKQEA